MLASCQKGDLGKHVEATASANPTKRRRLSREATLDSDGYPKILEDVEDCAQDGLSHSSNTSLDSAGYPKILEDVGDGPADAMDIARLLELANEKAEVALPATSGSLKKLVKNRLAKLIRQSLHTLVGWAR